MTVAVADFLPASYGDRDIIAGRNFSEGVRGMLLARGDWNFAERGEWERLAEEYSLAAEGLLEPSTALQIGRWTKAELLVTGRIERDIRTGRQDLIVEIIDPQRADLLTSGRLESIALAKNMVSVEAMEAATAAVERQLHEAREHLLRYADRPVIAPLFFENVDAAARLDFLEERFFPVIAESGRARAVRVLAFPGARESKKESLLTILGLTQAMGDWESIADLYVWGEFREIEPEGIPFPDVTVEGKVYLWNGYRDPVEVTRRFRVGDLETGLRTLAAAAIDAAGESVDDGAFSFTLRREIAASFQRRAADLRLPLIEARREQTVARPIIERTVLSLLETACFFNPSDSALHRGMLDHRWSSPGMRTTSVEAARERIRQYRRHNRIYSPGVQSGETMIGFQETLVRAFINRDSGHLSAEGKEAAREYVGMVRQEAARLQRQLESHAAERPAHPRRNLAQRRDYRLRERMLRRWIGFGMRTIPDREIAIDLVETLWPFYRAHLESEMNEERPSLVMEMGILGKLVEFCEEHRHWDLFHETRKWNDKVREARSVRTSLPIGTPAVPRVPAAGTPAAAASPPASLPQRSPQQRAGGKIESFFEEHGIPIKPAQLRAVPMLDEPGRGWRTSPGITRIYDVGDELILTGAYREQPLRYGYRADIRAGQSFLWSYNILANEISQVLPNRNPPYSAATGVVDAGAELWISFAHDGVIRLDRTTREIRTFPADAGLVDVRLRGAVRVEDAVYVFAPREDVLLVGEYDLTTGAAKPARHRRDRHRPE